tara:strand:+ start:1311 stop:1892 length:582 start_codon:yes stop_codon:yes gene_type:complete
MYILQPLQQKLKTLISFVPEITETLRVCQAVGMPNFYLAGGAITQVIWNDNLGRALTDGIKDLDIIYFDDGLLTQESLFRERVSQNLTHSIEIDVKNQAQLHIRYPDKFGCTIPAYIKVEQGINSWLSAFAIGVTFDCKDRLKIYAPYGLEDAFNMVVKPNKVAMIEANYLKMTKSYLARWPQITVVPWSGVN